MAATVYHMIKAQLSSLDFVVNRMFMKLFRTNNIEVVKIVVVVVVVERMFIIVT